MVTKTKQGRAYHAQFSSYRGAGTSHMKHMTGHKANGDNISTTAALHPCLKQKQTRYEHNLQTVASALLKAGKVLTNMGRDNLNVSLC